MKKLLFITVMLLGLFACSKETEDEPGRTGKTCWTFTLKQVTSVSPSMEGFPTTDISTIEKCGLTEKEASAVTTELSKTTTIPAGDYTMTVTTTVTKKRK